MHRTRYKGWVMLVAVLSLVLLLAACSSGEKSQSKRQVRRSKVLPVQSRVPAHHLNPQMGHLITIHVRYRLLGETWKSNNNPKR